MGKLDHAKLKATLRAAAVPMKRTKLHAPPATQTKSFWKSYRAKNKETLAQYAADKERFEAIIAAKKKKK